MSTHSAKSAKISTTRGPLYSVVTLIFALTLILLPTIAILSNKGVVPTFVLLSLCALFHARLKAAQWTGMRKGIIISAALIAWMGLSALWSPNPQQALILTLRLLALIGCGFIFAQSLKNRETGEKVMRFLLVGFALSLVVFIVEHKAGAPLTGLFKEGWIDPSRFKFGAVFITALGWFLLTQFRARLSPAMRLLALAGLLLLPFVSTSRSAQVASLFALGWFLFWHLLLVSRVGVMKSWRFLKINLKAGVLLVFITMPLLAVAVWHTVGSVQPEGLDRSAHHRFFIWDNVARMIPDHPLIGAGFDASRHYNPSEGSQTYAALPLHPHNAALQIWYELGAVGLLIVLSGVCLVLDRVNKPNRTQCAETIMPPDALSLGDGEQVVLRQCGFIFLLVISMLSWGLWQNRWFAELIFFAALLTIPQREKKPVRITPVRARS